MENKFKKILNSEHMTKYVGAIVIALLIILEILICVQYAGLNPNWLLMGTVLFCCVALDFMCVIDIFWVRKLRTRIILYCFDFLFLLAVCTITGNSYLSALYCIILTQFYINIDDFKSQLAVFISSSVAFVATFVLGWVLNHVGTSTYDTAVTVFSGCVLGVIIITAHFFVTLFLLGFYRTNLRLTKALKEADESKAELKSAYEQLSETAVYEERNRIARDIHDNAGHSMTAVIMQTEAAKLLIDTNPEEAKQKIISANIQAKNALEQMRDSVHLLAGRKETGCLKDELEEIIAQSMDGTDVKIRSNIDDVQTGVEKRRFIANTLKECIANGVRHGGATAFYVELKEEAGQISLTVSDNGEGLPEDFKEGYGLRGIREKAAAFGGNSYFESESGDGLEVRVTFPKDSKEES
jgi:signal transduction histidine kinase